MRPLDRLFFRAMGRTGGRAAVWSFIVLMLGALAQALSVVSPSSLGAGSLLVAAAGCSSLSLAVWVGVVAGPAGAMAALAPREWLGLTALGVRGRDLALPLGAWLSAGALLALICGHAVDPWARALTREARAAVTAQIRVSPGLVTALGPWALTEEAGQVRVASASGAVGRVRSLRASAAAGEVRAELGEGEVHAVNSDWALSFERATVRIGATGSARVSIGERATESLLQAKLDPYERWVLWKRTALPLALVGLGALGVVTGARLGWARSLALIGLSFWATLRLGDAWARDVGPTYPTAMLVLAPAVAALSAWATWRER